MEAENRSMELLMDKNDAEFLALKARWYLAEPTDVVTKQLGNGEWVVLAMYQSFDWYIWNLQDIAMAPGKKGYRYYGDLVNTQSKGKKNAKF